MMNSISKIFLVVLIVAGSGFCRDAWKEGIREIEPRSVNDEGEAEYHDDWRLPVGAKATRKYIVSDNNNNYLPITNCSDIKNEDGTNFRPGVFTPVQLEEQYVEADEKENIFYIYNTHHSVIHYVLTYMVTCGNSVTYYGVVHWLWDLHQCRKDCSSKDYDDTYHSVDLSTYDPATFTFITEKEDVMSRNKNYLPVEQIFNAWNGREVELPLYKGGNNRMDVPVLMIPGFRSDYSDTWGVTIPNQDKHSQEFRNGEVTGYIDGGFPYIMARYQGLDLTPEGINHNGIYFFNAPIDNEDKQPSPAWIYGDKDNSISYALYLKLVETLNDFYKGQWTTNDDMKIDLIGHSQGGVVVREMLRGMGNNPLFGVGAANPANHIRKLVTVNTPHTGTPVTASLEYLENPSNVKYSSLARLAREAADQAKLDKAAYDKIFKNCSKTDEKCLKKWHDKAVVNRDQTLISSDVFAHPDRIIDETILNPWVSVVGVAFMVELEALAVSAVIGFNTDVSMSILGNIVGDFSVKTHKEYPIIGTDTKYDDYTGEAFKDLRDYIYDARERGSHLGFGSPFIEELNKAYPTLPNGKNLEIQPMYSYNMSGLKGYLLGQIKEGADEICSGDSDDKNHCIDVVQMLADYVSKEERADLEENPDGAEALINYINTLLHQWLSRSDMIVPVESQTYGYDIDDNGNLVGDPWPNIPEFHKPRTSKIYLSTVPNIAPANLVIHGHANTERTLRVDQINSTIGIAHLPAADRMGMDILCALREDVCPADMDENYFLKIPEKIALGMVKTLDGTEKSVTVQELDLTGDFTIKPVYQSSDFQGVGINANGETVVVAAYDINKGTYYWYKDANGQEKIVTISDDPSIRWQVDIMRKDNTVTVKATSNEGEEKSFVVPVNLTVANTTLQVYGDENATSSVIFLGGTGTATDPTTQAPPTVATSRKEQVTGDIGVIHYEAGMSETNTSRPRFVVVNKGDKPLNGFKVAYYFTADPALSPEVEIDYPKYPVNLEYLGEDQWRFVLDLSDETLLPRSVSPNTNGYQIRLHYHEWQEWEHRDDYSADRNIGIPNLNDKIVVYDKNGNIVWGVPPTLPRTQTTIESKSVELTWVDAGAHEKNAFKPEFTLTNTGNTDLKNYKIRFFLRAPEGTSFNDPLDIWENTETEQTISAIAPNVWMVELNFNKHILYAGKQTFGGKFGIHLTNWADFNKEMLGLVVVDESGEIIWGSPWDGSGVAHQYMISFR